MCLNVVLNGILLIANNRRTIVSYSKTKNMIWSWNVLVCILYTSMQILLIRTTLVFSHSKRRTSPIRSDLLLCLKFAASTCIKVQYGMAQQWTLSNSRFEHGLNIFITWYTFWCKLFFWHAFWKFIQFYVYMTTIRSSSGSQSQFKHIGTVIKHYNKRNSSLNALVDH